MGLCKLYKGRNTPQGMKTESVETPVFRMWEDEGQLKEETKRDFRVAREESASCRAAFIKLLKVC